MAEQLFRNEVIEVGRNRLAGAVVAAVPPSSRLYTLLTLAAAVVLLLILGFGSYSQTAQVRGLVAYDAGVARIYPRSPGAIADLHVRPGDRVAAGQPLVTLAIAQGQGGLSGQLDQIAKQDTELSRQIDLAGQQALAEASALDRQHAGILAAIGSLKRQLVIAADQIRLSEAAAKRAERLASEGAGTQRQVEDSRSALLARRAERESLGEQLIAQRNALSANEAERARRQLDIARGQSGLEMQRAALAEQKLSLARDDRIVLTAPVAGTVGDIPLEIGQQARPDLAIASVIPADSKLEIWLYASSRAVGNARVGQRVRLQFDAFPYQKFGSGTGTVTDIARVATDPGNVDPGLKIDEPVFRIRARIDSFAPRARDEAGSLRPGMTLSAKLIVERRSLWQVILSPIFEALA